MKTSNKFKFVILFISLLAFCSCSGGESKPYTNMYGFNPEGGHAIKEKSILNKPENIVWKFKLEDGYELNYPVLADNFICFKAKKKGNKGKDAIYVLNCKDGKMQYRLKANRISSPVIYKGLLYYGEADSYPYFHAVDLKDGEEKWFFNSKNKSYKGDIKYPIISEDRIYFIDEGINENNLNAYIYKFNLKTKDVSMIKPIEYNPRGIDLKRTSLKSSPIIYKGNLFVQLSNEKIRAIDINMGNDQYDFDANGEIYDIAGGNDFIFVCGERSEKGEGFIAKFEPYIGGGKWEKDFQNCSIRGMSIDNKIIYASMQTPNGTSICAVDSYDGKVIWEKDYKDLKLSDIIVTNKMAYVSGDDGVYCFDKGTGEVKWKYGGGIGNYTAPLIYDDRIYFGVDNCFYCIK